MLSGLADEETALKIVHEGAQDYLVKGRFNADALSASYDTPSSGIAGKGTPGKREAYRSIGELVPFGIWTASVNGAITYLSDIFLEMVGMTMDECRGYGWAGAVHPDDISEMVSAWKKMRE